MGTRLLLLCVIYQTVIIASLGGVTLPLSDSIGKVTPIKPKPLSASTSSSSATSSSLVCEDVMPKLIPPATKGAVIREFSSPLVLTSTSRALPVPKIDSLSIENVKIPERLNGKFLSVCKAPHKKIEPDILSPDVSLPNKYQFLSLPVKLPNASPNCLSDIMCSSPLNKLSPLPSIKSLPNVPLESLKPNGIDSFSSSSNANQFSASPSITTFPKCRPFDSLSTSEAENPSYGEYFKTNSFSPLSSSCSLPYPLPYKSLYLPGVRTPSAPLRYMPISYKEAGSFNLPSISSCHDLLSSKSLDSDTGLNFLPQINNPYATPYLNSIKTTQILKPIEVPKTSSNVPLSTKTMCSLQNAVAKNLWPPREANYGSASETFESKLDSSSLNLRCDQNPLNFMANLEDDRTSDFKPKPCTPLKIKPISLTSPSNFMNVHATPLVPPSPTSPTLDELSNRINITDSLKYIDIPNMIPVIDTYVETTERLYSNDLGSNCQTSFDSKNVLSLDRVNLPSLSSYQHPSFTKERVSIPLKYSPPVMPTKPIASIYSGTSSLSPIIYCPSRTLQTSSTPVAYIKQSPSSSIAQTTSNMVSSITNLVSNIVQNILSSYKSYIPSATKIPQTPTYTIQSNPYTESVLKSKAILPVIPLPQGNPLNTISVPVISVSTDCLYAPTSDSSTVLSCESSASEVSSSQRKRISSPQPVAPILPPSSLITRSSPQLCPSYLPSPILPACPAIGSPFYMETPVFKVSSSKKDSKVEKMLELMLLAEILNNDESFDWDDLDTLLAFLSLS